MLSDREQSRSTSDVACPDLEGPQPWKIQIYKIYRKFTEKQASDPQPSPPPPPNTITPSDPLEIFLDQRMRSFEVTHSLTTVTCI